MLKKRQLQLWDWALRELWYEPEAAYREHDEHMFFYDWRHDLQDFMD